MSLTVVTYKWKPRPGYRSTFGPETVNVLKRMVDRHYPDPHRFVCLTDDPTGIDADVDVLPMWEDFADVPSPHGGKNPSCYRRLRSFSAEAKDLFGPRFVSIDLDCVITGDLRPVWNRYDDFVIWGDTNPQPGSHYNCSMVLMSAGARRQVWEKFNPLTSPQQSLKARCYGSDQGWVSYILGPGEVKWTKADGVYSFRNDLRAGHKPLPADARVVIFHGCIDPWSVDAQRLPWVKEHWC